MAIKQRCPRDRCELHGGVASTKELTMRNAIRKASTHVLYRIFDRHGHLLYIGITNDAGRRFVQHLYSQPWAKQMTDIKLEHFKTRWELAEAEIAAIQAEHPKYNKTHSIISPPEVIGTVVNNGRVANIFGPDANNFYTGGPDKREWREPRIRIPLPCPECCMPYVYQRCDARGETTDDIVHCYDDDCGWTGPRDILYSFPKRGKPL